MKNNFDIATSRLFAIIFTVMLITTLLGIIFKQAWWHIYTLIVTAILAVKFWTEKDDSDKSPI